MDARGQSTFEFACQAGPGAFEGEWVLSNRLGAFAMGTPSGLPRRRYHALLVASRSPPVDRVATLQAIDEHVRIGPPADAPEARLTPFRFTGAPEPLTPSALHAFEFDGGSVGGHGGCRWTYRWGHARVEIRKELRIAREGNLIELTYDVDAGATDVALSLTPLVSLRDFHALSFERPMDTRTDHAGFVIASDGVSLHLAGDAQALPSPAWWRGFEYDLDRDRGQDFREDLFAPGTFERAGSGRWRMRVTASVDGAARPDLDAEALARSAQVRGWSARACTGIDKAHHGAVARLVGACDAFVVRREGGGVSLLAGFPWFADWGRDAMISLPGAFLETGRHEDARTLLETFARHTRDGIVPNRFDDRTGEVHDNTVDASLWFLHAAAAWAHASGEPLTPLLRETCLGIVEAYRAGTRHGIGLDDGLGLLIAGSEHTQLTWMDAARDGVVFTPRHGACVEINALWHHGLLAVARALGSGDAPGRLRALAASAADSFRRHLWNERLGCCADRLEPGAGGTWHAVEEVRPNQVLAASLEFSPLTRAQRQGVVASVRQSLLVPLGLRTLDPAAPGYRPRFEGSLFERDAAYHNGTVWPWLIGPMTEAMARLGATRTELLETLAPLVEWSSTHGFGHVAEVFDADEPRRPGGCPAQLWSAAELLRALRIAASAPAGLGG